jgi:pilus assembly protein CpaE
MTILYDPRCHAGDHLETLLGGSVRLVNTVDDLEVALARDQREQLVLVGPGAELADALPFASRQRLSRPALGVVLLRDGVDPEHTAEAVRAGVREVAEAGDADAVLDACFRSLARSTELAGAAGEVPGRGRVISVVGAKGGCGKTTVATNLAVALAAVGASRVCLIDLDLAFGDVAIVLQLDPERTVADAVAVAGGLDDASFYQLLTPYSHRIDALLAPIGPVATDQVDQRLVGTLLRLARGLFDYVVVDTPPSFTDPVIAALAGSDAYVLLATPDIPALKNLRLTLDMFDLLAYPADQRFVVLNRADDRTGLTPADIEHVIRGPIHAHVPTSRDVPISLNRGVPIVTESPHHPVSRSIVDFVAEWLVPAQPAPVPVRWRLAHLRRGAVAR